METIDLFAFLKIEPNAEVGTIHPKAIPVILTKAEEIETWLTAPSNGHGPTVPAAGGFAQGRGERR